MKTAASYSMEFINTQALGEQSKSYEASSCTDNTHKVCALFYIQHEQICIITNNVFMTVFIG